MKNDKYVLKAESSFTVFEFTSKGPKGLILKLIQYQKTDQPNLYNLAFGNKNILTGKVDDVTVSDNSDSGKVLATIVSSLYAFFDKHPDAFVYAAGNSRARMRLYRMTINRFHNEIIQDFNLYGQMEDKFYEFEIGKDYLGFLVQQKFLTLQYYEDSART